MNFRRSAVIAMALLLLPLLSSCVSVLNPTGWGPVTFDGNTAFVITSKGKLSAVNLDGDTGTAKWTFPDKDRNEDDGFKTRAIYGAPVVDGDRVYVASFDGGVFALNKDTGRPVWPGVDGNRGKIRGDIAGGVALAGDKLFFGTTDGRLYGWNKADGTPAQGWNEPKSFDSGIWATPVVSGDTLYVATMGGELHALSVADGAVRWIEPFTATGAIADLSLAANDLLFVPSINRHIYLVRTTDGSIAADYRAEDWVWTAPTLADSKLFFGDFGGDVYALDITKSPPTELWAPVNVEDERIRAGAALIGDTLIVADRKPVVTFIRASNGEILNRVPLPGVGTVRANLVVKDGAAYISTTGGKLYRADPDGRRVVEVVLSGVKK